jgi:predicted metal-dependent TIM-barrel fold hydrolase
MSVAYVNLHSDMLERSRPPDYLRLSTSGCRFLLEASSFFEEDNSMPLRPGTDLERVLYLEPRQAAQSGVRHLTSLSLPTLAELGSRRVKEHFDYLATLLKHPQVVAVSLPLAGLSALSSRIIEQLQIVACAKQSLIIDLPPFGYVESELSSFLSLLPGTSGIEADRIVVNRALQRSVPRILSSGFHCGLRLDHLPENGNLAAIEIIEKHGGDRICLTSPHTGTRFGIPEMPSFIREMRRRGHPASAIRQLVLDNPLSVIQRAGRSGFLH